MKRKIKFRGMKRRSKKIVYGEYLYNSVLDQHIITEPKPNRTGEKYRADYAGNFRYHLVERKTVGQYTGVDDINGVEIYEHDIISVSDENGVSEIREVTYEDGAYFPIGHLRNVDYEVLGNAYENKELLKDTGFVYKKTSSMN